MLAVEPIKREFDKMRRKKSFDWVLQIALLAYDGDVEESHFM